MRRVIIGVDGGGTKTKLLAMDAATGRPIGESEAGGLHISLGMDTAVHHLKTAMEGLQLAPSDQIVAMGIGDPSIDDSADQAGNELIRQIRVRRLCPPEAVCVSKSDVFMALYAFSGGEPAALLVAGTGSMGIALPAPYRHGERNDVLTVGGWGIPANDPGSGYSIALQGITAALHAFDGIAPPTMLCDEVQRAFGVSAPRELIAIFNGGAVTRTQIAAFSMRVDACASLGDRTAAAILTDAGEVLGRYGLSLLRRIDGAPRRLGIYGGVLLHNARVRQVFEQTVHADMEQAEIAVPSFPPEYGAARYAADSLR